MSSNASKHCQPASQRQPQQAERSATHTPHFLGPLTRASSLLGSVGTGMEGCQRDRGLLDRFWGRTELRLEQGDPGFPFKSGQVLSL